jgi:SAM-dependent methyltransferase
VAGAGTFEAVVVAQAFPEASEIVAVDLSATSLETLKRRYFLARLTRFHRHWPTLTCEARDLFDYRPERPFDLILASNLIQHVSDPADLLLRFSNWLSPQGQLRVVTYPRSSRIWMRETRKYFENCGLTAETPALEKRCREKIAELPLQSAIRSCFESQPETRHAAGLIDAFFNSHENPMNFLQWRAACARAGLALTSEDQAESSRSSFLDQLLKREPPLLENAWTKLQVLDDLLELCANPVFWFSKTPPAQIAFPESDPDFASPREELDFYLARARKLLGPVPLEEVLAALKTQVGPRVSAPPEGRELPGLSILDYV